MCILETDRLILRHFAIDDWRAGGRGQRAEGIVMRIHRQNGRTHTGPPVRVRCCPLCGLCVSARGNGLTRSRRGRGGRRGQTCVSVPIRVYLQTGEHASSHREDTQLLIGRTRRAAPYTPHGLPGAPLLAAPRAWPGNPDHHRCQAAI